MNRAESRTGSTLSFALIMVTALILTITSGIPSASAIAFNEITISSASGATTSEGLGTVTFDVALSASPQVTETITVAIASSDTTEATVSSASLLFDDTNWSVPQQITVTGVDDTVVDGSIAYSVNATMSNASLGSTYTPASINLSNTDNETAAFTVTASGGTTSTSETATTDSFTVVLDKQPVGNVVVNVTSGDTGEGTVDKASLTFTTGDWHTAQTVTVTGIDDTVVDGTITYNITLAINDATSEDNWDAVADQTLSVTNTDDETAAFTVTATDGTTSTSESGTTDSFTVVLDKQPVGNVVVNVTSGDTSEGTVDKASLTFTTGDWHTAQTVTVTGIDDTVVDGTITYDITLAIDDATSEDNWDAVADQTLPVSNTDTYYDQAPEPTPTPTFGDLGGLSVEAVNSIQRLVELGITNGVSSTEFAPNSVVVRADMALFLVRELEAAGFTLPTVSGSGFADTSGLTAEAQHAVAVLAELGITTGTADGLFDPSGEVDRWQMAIFLTRVLQTLGISLPTDPPATFTDLDGYSSEAQLAINQLASIGITTGTSENQFSPDQSLPRWQMAIFLIRVIDEVA